MTPKQRYPLHTAQVIGEALRRRLEPFTKRIEIAGSIRRGREDVGDIELVYVPYMRPATDLFGDTLGQTDDIDFVLARMIKEDQLEKRKNSAGRYIGYGSKNKYLVDRSGIPVDIFSAPEANFGMTMVIRTGPAEFNMRLMQRFLDLGMKGHVSEGMEDKWGNWILCATEEEVFKLAQWDYLEPEDRR